MNIYLIEINSQDEKLIQSYILGGPFQAILQSNQCAANTFLNTFVDHKDLFNLRSTCIIGDGITHLIS